MQVSQSKNCVCGRLALRGVAPALLVGLLTAVGCNQRSVTDVSSDRQEVESIRAALLKGGGAGEETAAAEPTGAGWATLKGSFVFDGTVPAPKTKKVDKDVEFCTQGGHVIVDRSLEVGPDKGLANVVVYARKVRRIHDDAKKPPEGQALFDQVKCDFVERVVVYNRHQTLLIKNSDAVGHNTNVKVSQGTPINPIVPGGGSTTYDATAEEKAPALVTCNIHPWMEAYLFPRDTNYFAVTKADGSFEIPNLPAGEEIELQVWHERGADPQGGLFIDQPNLGWKRNGRFSVKLNADESKDLGKLSVPATSIKDI